MAGPRCTVCDHAKRDEIDRALVADRASDRAIASKYGLTRSSVQRHGEKHLPERLAQAVEKREGLTADSLVKRLEELSALARGILEANYEDGRVQVAAVRELARHLELEAKILGQLKDRVEVDIKVTVEWQRYRAIVLLALQPFPEAAEAVAAQLEEEGL